MQAISGADAFLLYDTFGFPLELTQEMAEARGVSVDGAGFTVAMEEQRRRSKDSREEVDLTAGGLRYLFRAVGGPVYLRGSDLQDLRQWI